MNVLVLQAMEKAQEFVLALCTPDKMSKGEALRFLDGVGEFINSERAALREEMGDEEV